MLLLNIIMLSHLLNTYACLHEVHGNALDLLASFEEEGMKHSRCGATEGYKNIRHG